MAKLEKFLQQWDALRGELGAAVAVEAAQQPPDLAERIQDLDPRIKERIARAAAASTASKKFGC